jgi:glycosyltransferase involved in cell wall biosynthesis
MNVARVIAEVFLSSPVSVVIPAWNAEGTLKQCLDSVLRQTVKPLEILVIDDGSDDGTAELADSPSVRLLDTGGRMGPAWARNKGAAAATGEVILFLDSDVTIPDDLIETVAGHFSDPCVWAVQTLYSPVCPASDPVSRYQNFYYYYSLNRMPQGSTATFATWCSAVRRDRFQELGGFNVRIPEPTVEDEELGYTIADSGGVIVLDKTIQVTHLASYTLAQFTRRRLRMARAQAKSGWRSVKDRLLARYINVRESGTHHSRWMVLSIILVLLAQVSAVTALALNSPEAGCLWGALILMALLFRGRFLRSSSRVMGPKAVFPFALLCVYDMAVLGWGIVHGTLQFAWGRKY